MANVLQANSFTGRLMLSQVGEPVICFQFHTQEQGPSPVYGMGFGKTIQPFLAG
jgi:hypothetical protein